MGEKVTAEVAEMETRVMSRVVVLEEIVMSMRKYNVPSKMVGFDSGHDDDFHDGSEFISTPTEMERVNAKINAFISAIVGEDEKKDKGEEENKDKEIGELEQRSKGVEEENANKGKENQNEGRAKEDYNVDAEMPKDKIGTKGVEEEEKAEDKQNEEERGKEEDQEDVGVHEEVMEKVDD